MVAAPSRYKRDEFRANSKDEIRPEAALISFVPRSQYCDERRTLIFPVPRTETGRGKKKEEKFCEIRWMVMSPWWRFEPDGSRKIILFSFFGHVSIPPSCNNIFPRSLSRKSLRLIFWTRCRATKIVKL